MGSFPSNAGVGVSVTTLGFPPAWGSRAPLHTQCRKQVGLAAGNPRFVFCLVCEVGLLLVFTVFPLEIDCFLFVFVNREFTKTIKRPFGVKYNPYTRSIQILKDTESIASAMNELRHDFDVVSDALANVSRSPSV